MWRAGQHPEAPVLSGREIEKLSGRSRQARVRELLMEGIAARAHHARGSLGVRRGGLVVADDERRRPARDPLIAHASVLVQR
jgi:hypothetical protein